MKVKLFSEPHLNNNNTNPEISDVCYGHLQTFY